MSDISTTEPRLAHFPVSFFASVMGVSGCATALHAAGLPGLSVIALALTIALFLALAAAYALKALRHPKAVAAEWQHPVKLAFFPAITISLLLIAVALTPVMPGLARIIWMVGAVGQGGLTLAVLSNWIGHRAFQQIHISPAWFIPAVGNVVAPIAGVTLGFPETSWLFFSAGLIFWVVLLVLVMNRLIFHDPLPGPMVPTLAILIAPPAVAFLAWLQLNGGVLDSFARVLYSAALVFLGLAMTQAGKLRRLRFGLSHWAMSFPVAALTLATLRFAALTDSIAHVWAGTAALILLCGIVTFLIFATLRAMLRGEICRPEHPFPKRPIHGVN
ncbi:C4-dicarboxylate ABC transporter [Epibacterium sp. SM1979]|uniref:C4-dicarboxylate ABC transporter n=1 Tax=Tritonibacter litoralis TaxID=2662264 RepID=A0A843YE98_9RHOB|nr:SLAC1 anion channel family protein [Tritonibacter litoralis]MQQ07784.1 C4-dicarboxylate ABC transporter [Tritonibacter litoralis]